MQSQVEINKKAILYFKKKTKHFPFKKGLKFIKYFEVFNAGIYPQGKFTKEEVQELANIY